jgi:hypothetical protein
VLLPQGSDAMLRRQDALALFRDAPDAVSFLSLTPCSTGTNSPTISSLANASLVMRLRASSIPGALLESASNLWNMLG